MIGNVLKQSGWTTVIEEANITSFGTTDSLEQTVKGIVKTTEKSRRSITAFFFSNDKTKYFQVVLCI